jgi:hypothetical protein
LWGSDCLREAGGGEEEKVSFGWVFAFVAGNCITTLLDIKIVLWGSGFVCWVERKKERQKSEHHLPVKQGELFIFGCK